MCFERGRERGAGREGMSADGERGEGQREKVEEATTVEDLQTAKTCFGLFIQLLHSVC